MGIDYTGHCSIPVLQDLQIKTQKIISCYRILNNINSNI